MLGGQRLKVGSWRMEVGVEEGWRLEGWRSELGGQRLVVGGWSVGCWSLEVGDGWKLEVGVWMPEVGCWMSKDGVGSWTLRVGDQMLEGGG